MTDVPPAQPSPAVPPAHPLLAMMLNAAQSQRNHSGLCLRAWPHEQVLVASARGTAWRMFC